MNHKTHHTTFQQVAEDFEALPDYKKMWEELKAWTKSIKPVHPYEREAVGIFLDKMEDLEGEK